MSNEGTRTTPKFCGNCGQKLLEGATFCAYCGSPVPSVDSAGVVSSKPPSSYNSIQPSVSSRGAPAYQAPYRPERIRAEPVLPFIQHFQGVLISPQLEMPQIVERPNFRQPLFLVLIAGILAGITILITYSKVTPDFTDEFIRSVGYTSDMSEFLDLDTLMQMSLMIGEPLGFLVSWIIIDTFVLWGLHAVISSEVPSYKRNYKIMATITGWSFLPRIFEQIVNIILVILFVPPSTITINSMSDLAVLDALGLPDEIALISFLFGLVIQLWSVVIVYFAVKSIDPIGSHAIMIVIAYALLPYVFSFILSFIIPFGLPI